MNDLVGTGYIRAIILAASTVVGLSLIRHAWFKIQVTRLYHAPPVVIGIGLFVLALFLRLPFFFHSVIEWDESSLILMGQDVLDGHLPYVHYWDHKPPLAFLSFAILILVFGKSVVGIRLGGLFVVFLSSWILYKTARKTFTPAVGVWAGILTLVSTTIIPGGPVVLAEHFVVLALCAILYFLFTQSLSTRYLIVIGLVAGISVLIRTNMVFFAIGMVAVVLSNTLHEGILKALKKVAVLCLGMLLPLIVVVTVYGTAGQLELLYKSTIQVSLAWYSKGASITKEAGFDFEFFQSRSFFFLSLPFMTAMVIIGVANWIKSRDPYSPITMTVLLGIFVALSIYTMPKPFTHYRLQLTPFFAILIGVGLAHLVDIERKWFVVGLAATVFVLSLLIVMNFKREYYKEDTGYQVAAYLNQQGVDGQYVYLIKNPIAYWLTNARLPLKYVHPSNVGKENMIRLLEGEGMTSDALFKTVLAKKPLFIVKPNAESVFLAGNRSALLKEELENHYTLSKTFGSTLVYERKIE